MKRVFSISSAVVLLAVCGLFSTALAQSEAAANITQDFGDGPTKIIKHGINPNGADTPDASSASVGAASEESYGADGELNQGGRGRFSLTTGGTGSVTPVIAYHNGPLIATPVVYLLWYGNWNRGNGTDTPAGQQIIRDWASSIGGSAHFQINSTYNISGWVVTGNVTYGGQATISGYPQGTSLTDTEVKTVVNNAITSGKVPYNAAGVYFVLTSSDVSESSGFCTQYCGWHTAATPSAGHIRYSFVGNAARCISSCAAQSSSPNGNAGVDGMISVMTHELEEATTDPDLNAWYDSQGAENADKCAWTFGHFQYQVGNGSWANIHLGARDFLIQRNLRRSGTSNFCMMDSTHN